MRKLVASTFVSLDGVMQAPGGPEEDPTGPGACMTPSSETKVDATSFLMG